MIGDWHHRTPVSALSWVTMGTWGHTYRLQRYWNSLAGGHAMHGCHGTLGSAQVDDIEFYSLKLIQHLCNVTCRPLTLWPSDRYGPRWAGREAWVTYGGGRTRQLPANAATGSRPLMTLLPRHYHARIVKHYAS